LVGAVCRPPRDIYQESDLVGGIRAAFSFGETRARIKKYYRQDVELINTRNQRLQCSHYRPCVVTSSDGRLPCVIYCHTNSGSRRDAEEILFTLLPKGITVFALDFSGSGKSDGDWVTLGAHEVEDLSIVVQYIREEGSTSTLALWGRSMGAVTALLYSHRDPSIAGIVVDSPFSRLTDLMFELATDTQQGLSVPRPLVKIALTMMRRSVRRKADFSIDDVAPLDVAKEMYVPVLFGHAEEDSFIPAHHSERLFEAHGAETKNFIKFDGDHNGARPEFWYDSALIFLLGVLRVEELVGPEIDLHSIDLEQAPHMRGAGIYVAGFGTSTGEERGDHGGEEGEEEEEEEEEARAVFVRAGKTRAVAAPWDISNSRLSSSAVTERTSERRKNNRSKNSRNTLSGIVKTPSAGTPATAGTWGGGAREPPAVGNISDYIDYGGEQEEQGEEDDDEDNEEAIMQKVIALSLVEAQSSISSSLSGARSSPQAPVGTETHFPAPAAQGEATKRASTDVAGGEEEEEYDEEAALAAAIAESLKTSSPSAPAPAVRAEVSTADVAQHGQRQRGSLTEQSIAREHSQQEADAVHEAVESVHHQLEEDLIDMKEQQSSGCSQDVLVEKMTEQMSEAENVTEAEEQQLEDYLEHLRAQSAKLAGN